MFLYIKGINYFGVDFSLLIIPLNKFIYKCYIVDLIENIYIIFAIFCVIEKYKHDLLFFESHKHLDL